MTARTLPQLLERAAEHDPEGLALVLPEPTGERRMSYRQLAADSPGWPLGLARLGLRRGDRILVWLPDLPEWFVAQFAAARLGLTVVAVDTRYRGSEIACILQTSHARGSSSSLRGSSASTSCPWRRRQTTAPGSSSSSTSRPLTERSALRASSLTARLRHRPGPMTSPPFSLLPGTAAPKLAAHDQQSIVEHAHNVAAATGMRPGDALLLALTTAGVFGFSGAMAALAAGATLVCSRPSRRRRDGDPARALPDHPLLRPGRNAAGGAGRGRRLIPASRAGAGVPSQTSPRGSRSGSGAGRGAAGVRLHGTYGSSECFALMSTWPLEAPAATRARAGGYLVSPNMQVRCVAPGTGTLQPVGEPGELQFPRL